MMAKIDVRITILDNDVCMIMMRMMKFPNIKNAINSTQISTTFSSAKRSGPILHVYTIHKCTDQNKVTCVYMATK